MKSCLLPLRRTGREPRLGRRWHELTSCLGVVLALALAACATTPMPERAQSPAAVARPLPLPSPLTLATRWQIDEAISAASAAAVGRAREWAQSGVETWRQRVRQLGETDFIPWFAGYWTQQWLALRLAWYKLDAGEGKLPPEQRLAVYLATEYQERVLDAVAAENDPRALRDAVTATYVGALADGLRAFASLEGIAPDQFDSRLQAIPVIVLGPSKAQAASLYQLVHARSLATLPAYAALGDRLPIEGAGHCCRGARVGPLAQRTREQLGPRLAASGGASVASAVFGGVAGMMISLGAAGVGAALHADARPRMEAQLRQDLNAAADDLADVLLEDSAGGVLAGAFYLAAQIEAQLDRSLTQPIALDPLPRETDLPPD
ncbi:MAG TPA: hypothetical protein PKL28_12715 [Rhodocyclaceae bacterium]|nr:hypothetical protein [Rhodocyclaceae bacterium]